MYKSNMKSKMLGGKMPKGGPKKPKVKDSKEVEVKAKY